ncbi:MAG: ABC transporter substrate-binding protein [Burkholderiales bacterium]|nr:ABC transporter substrate-binding protein [Burkholderiales bacterium]
MIRTTNRGFWLQAAICAFALVWAGVRAAEPAPPLKKLTLQLNWKHQFQFAGYYVAVEKGYYREEGLEVGIVEVRQGRDPVDEVLEGSAQFGVGASELALRRGRGDPVVVLAVILQHSPLVLLAHGQGLQSLRDLEEKRVMLMAHETELYAFLRREGVPRERIVEVPHTYAVADLIAGKVDALSGYATDEPYLLRSAGFAYTLFSPRASGIDFYGDSLFTSERVLREDPQAVAAMRRASLRGWEYALRHPAEVAELIRARYSTRKSLHHLRFEAAEMANLMQPDLIEIGHINPKRWQHIAGVYAELGMLQAPWSLEGFIYDPDPMPDMIWVYRGLWAAAAALLVFGLLAWRQSRFNRALRLEIAKRAQVEGELRQANGRLQGQLGEIRALQTRLEEQAVRDSLTGLHNRRYLDETLGRELQRAGRNGYPVSLVLIDVDRFKNLNDSHGHQAGDTVLRALADLLGEGVRAGDLVCRWGG